MYRRVVLVILLIVLPYLLVVIACRASAYVYTHYGALGMADRNLPVPRGAELVGEYTSSERVGRYTTSKQRYVVNRRLYLLHLTMEDALDWFGRCVAFPTQTPNQPVFIAHSFPSGGCGDEYAFYVMASNVTRGDPDLSEYYWEDTLSCFGVSLYKTADLIPSDELGRFGKIVPIKAGFTGVVALVSRCWPEQ